MITALVIFIILLIICIFILIYSYKKYKSIFKVAQEWDPFGQKLEWVYILKCKKCGQKIELRDSEFSRKGIKIGKRGAYIFKEVGKHIHCGGVLIISAMYVEKKKTIEELKWEELDKKWH